MLCFHLEFVKQMLQVGTVEEMWAVCGTYSQHDDNTMAIAVCGTYSQHDDNTMAIALPVITSNTQERIHIITNPIFEVFY